MSAGNYPVIVAYETASCFYANVKEWAERLVIAGSLRRLMSNPDVTLNEQSVGDVEMLAIPCYENEKDLFGEVIARTNLLWQRLDDVYEPWQNPKRWGDIYRKVRAPVPRTIASRIDAIPIDFYVVTPQNWGYRLAIRTGPATWSRALVRDRGLRTKDDLPGLKPPDLTLRDNHVYCSGRLAPVRDELEFFDTWSLPAIPPHKRTPETIKTLGG